MNNSEAYAGAALIGTMAGMRSMSAPAVIGQLSRKGTLDDVAGGLALVKGGRFAIAATLLSAGELIADELPFIPNRTAAGPLLGRAMMGALSGAVIFAAGKRSKLTGALIGAAFAVGAAYGAYELRKRIGKKLQVPDAVVALAEDAMVGAMGITLTSRLSRLEH